jgi:hypothetical protein
MSDQTSWQEPGHAWRTGRSARDVDEVDRRILGEGDLCLLLTVDVQRALSLIRPATRVASVPALIARSRSPARVAIQQRSVSAHVSD